MAEQQNHPSTDLAIILRRLIVSLLVLLVVWAFVTMTLAYASEQSCSLAHAAIAIIERIVLPILAILVLAVAILWRHIK